MRIILTFVTLIMLAVVIVPDWISPEPLGPRPDLQMPNCIDC